MTRSSPVSLVLACLAVLVSGVDSLAASEAPSSPAKKTPAGLRVAYTLMSNGQEMEAIVKAADIPGHKLVNGPHFGTWHGFVGGGREGIRKDSQEVGFSHFPRPETPENGAFLFCATRPAEAELHEIPCSRPIPGRCGLQKWLNPTDCAV